MRINREVADEQLCLNTEKGVNLILAASRCIPKAKTTSKIAGDETDLHSNFYQHVVASATLREELHWPLGSSEVLSGSCFSEYSGRGQPPLWILI